MPENYSDFLGCSEVWVGMVFQLFVKLGFVILFQDYTLKIRIVYEA